MLYSIVVAVGLTVLIVVSVAVGIAVAHEDVAKKREALLAKDWDLWIRENQIVTAAAVTGCPCCALLRTRAELQSPAPE
ncbi:hypothetical protein [Pseudonocardia sp.]|jgi:hypothetical protein|uniref:hypothetical protein n=1 Tax=Pseudonocardia sp. TaxID=60912 RepID=UPI0031FDB32E